MNAFVESQVHMHVLMNIELSPLQLVDLSSELVSFEIIL